MKFLLTISLCFCAVFIYSPGKAQSTKISLNDIAKVRLITGGDSYSEYEITQGSAGIWTCRQTILNDFEKKIPTFNKVISRDKLNELLTYFNDPDTSINLDRFDLKYAELVRHMDSIKYISFTPVQRRTFMGALGNRDTLTTALRRIFAISWEAGRYYKRIALITKIGAEYLMESKEDGYPYDLPWTFHDYRMFDPRIVRLFYELTGKEKIERLLHDYLYGSVVNKIYYVNFQTSFSWANFRADHPGAAALAGSTLSPYSFSIWAEHPRGLFSSALLPRNWLINVLSAYPDSAMRRLRKTEELVVAAYKKNKKSFDEIGVKPTEFLFFEIFGRDTEDDVYEEEVMLKDLKTRFPELDGIDKKQVIMMMVWDMIKPSHSKMLLLPDGKLIELNK